MDQYFDDKPRQREWFPDYIPGLHRLSRNEIFDDLDSIQAISVYAREKAAQKRKSDLIDEGVPGESEISKKIRLAHKIVQVRFHLPSGFMFTDLHVRFAMIVVVRFCLLFKLLPNL